MLLTVYLICFCVDIRDHDLGADKSNAIMDVANVNTTSGLTNGTLYESIKHSTAAEVAVSAGASWSIWKILGTLAKTQGAMMLNYVLNEFPVFEQFLHEITEKKDPDYFYEIFLDELNVILKDRTDNQIQLPDSHALKTWIQETEEGTEFAVNAILKKFGKEMNAKGSQEGLNELQKVHQKLNIDVKRIADHHVTYFKQLPDQTALQFSDVVNVKLRSLKKPFWRRMADSWKKVSKRNKILSLAGSIVGGALIAFLLTKHFNHHSKDRKQISGLQ
eukprot:NODE_126_length_17250_cov_2.558743.p9 type:complete len:275 gc:universal NODE_126_length_17250_cov_2.558743:9523-10347(+)